MPSIPELAVNDWKDLQAQAARFDVARSFQRVYVFRGHYDISWRLMPTLHRAAALDGARPLPSVQELLDLETKLLERFRQEAPNLLPPAVLQSTHTDVDWWPLMRHHGAPTRLLDWTISFYVAAYFAAASQPRTDGVIYVLYLKALSETMTNVHGVGGAFNGKTINIVTKKSNAPPAVHMMGRSTALLDRMTAQQGIFMASLNVATDIEDALETHVPFVMGGETSQLKIRIPAALKAETVRRLRAMNITPATLFPGLDGIGRALDDIVRYP